MTQCASFRHRLDDSEVPSVLARSLVNSNCRVRTCRWCFASWPTSSARRNWRNGARTTRHSTSPPTWPSVNFSRVCSDAPTKTIGLFPCRRRWNWTRSRRVTAAAAAMHGRQSRAPSCSSPSCCVAPWRQ